MGIENELGRAEYIKSFYDIKEALKALMEHKNPTAYIDLWDEGKYLNQTFSKSDLIKNIKNL